MQVEHEYTRAGATHLFAAFDTRSGQVEETVRTSLSARAPLGSTPDALALTRDGKRLYVANADNNNVCVIDISARKRSRVQGFIPTGWYPTAVAVSSRTRLRRKIMTAGKF